MDTFGCTPKFIAENPKAAQALADSYFQALEMIRSRPQKAFAIMGADVKQSAEQFEASQKYLRWQDKAFTRSSSPASTPRSARRRPNCCSEPGSSSRCPT